jgi:hypothetical protein
MTLSRRRNPFLDLLALFSPLAEEAPESAARLDEAAAPGQVVVAFRDLRRLPRAAPVLPVAGEADDQVRMMVSVA